MDALAEILRSQAIPGTELEPSGPQMTVDAVVFLMGQAKMFSKNITPELVRQYLLALVSGTLAPVVVAKGKEITTKGVNYVQLSSLLQWAAERRGVTYAECLSQFVRMKSVGTRLRRIFDAFGSAACRNRMTVADFTRFCSAFDLFVPKVFTPGSIFLLFKEVGERSSVDYQCFRRLLSKIASLLGMDSALFASALAVHAENRASRAAKRV